MTSTKDSIQTKLTVIVSTYNEPLSLWHTIYGLKTQIKELPYLCELFVGNNGDSNPCTQEIQKYGVRVFDIKEPSTALVRNIPAKEASGEILCFADNHVVLEEHYLQKALAHFDNPEVHVLHGRTRLWGDKDGFYSYYLTLDTNFCGCNCFKKFLDEPYNIPASGHGLYFIRRSVFEHIGGYFDEQKQWGGEEIGLALLCWMYGYSVTLDPNLVHWHLPLELRKLSNNRNGLYYFYNLFISAYVCGGEEYLDKVYNNHKHLSPESFERLRKEAILASQHRRDKVLTEAQMDIAGVLEYFDSAGIPHREQK